MKAFDSLSKAEKRVVVTRLLDDSELREEVLDIGRARVCETEPASLLEKSLADKGAE